MSNKKYNDSLITDERTLMRRAWIDLALSSVRSQLKFDPVAGVDTLAAGYDQADSEPEERRPNLYLAYSDTSPRTKRSA